MNGWEQYTALTRELNDVRINERTYMHQYARMTQAMAVIVGELGQQIRQVSDRIQHVGRLLRLQYIFPPNPAPSSRTHPIEGTIEHHIADARTCLVAADEAASEAERLGRIPRVMAGMPQLVRITFITAIVGIVSALLQYGIPLATFVLNPIVPVADAYLLGYLMFTCAVLPIGYIVSIALSYLIPLPRIRDSVYFSSFWTSAAIGFLTFTACYAAAVAACIFIPRLFAQPGP